MNLNRNQLSLLITLFSMSILVLLLFNIHLGGMKEEQYVIEMSLADEDIEELLKEEEKRLEELANNEPIKSHMALNETAKPTVGNPEPLKTLEELMEERALNNDEGESSVSDSAFAEQLKKLTEQREEKKQKLGEREAQKEEFTNYLKDRRTSISFSLVDRNAYSLPPPIYTCIEGGKVVVNIKVDANGYVTEADFNAESSGTTNGCLVDNAIAYALKARFSPDSRSSQIGTITYLFQWK